MAMESSFYSHHSSRYGSLHDTLGVRHDDGSFQTNAQENYDETLAAPSAPSPRR
jgi:hypothetical protein